MSDPAVSRLYDELCRVESRSETRRAYPVHKKLALEGGADRDIYDWILDSVELGAGATVLDAGCGVGFGTLKLAQAGDVSVTGVSLSRHEVNAARNYARKSGSGDKVAFRQASFDEAGGARFDLIVAVESLKHSGNIENSLRQLIESLAADGELIIVDDLFSGSEQGPHVACLKDSWHLAKLYRLQDYAAVLQGCEVVDLTHAIRRRAPLWSRVRFLALMPLAAFPGSWGRIAKIFRGGVALECLYSRGAMRYLVIRYRKWPGIKP